MVNNPEVDNLARKLGYDVCYHIRDHGYNNYFKIEKATFCPGFGFKFKTIANFNAEKDCYLWLKIQEKANA